jgi:hypothetical protein
MGLVRSNLLLRPLFAKRGFLVSPPLRAVGQILSPERRELMKR